MHSSSACCLLNARPAPAAPCTGGMRALRRTTHPLWPLRALLPLPPLRRCRRCAAPAVPSFVGAHARATCCAHAPCLLCCCVLPVLLPPVITCTRTAPLPLRPGRFAAVSAAVTHGARDGTGPLRVRVTPGEPCLPRMSSFSRRIGRVVHKAHSVEWRRQGYRFPFLAVG